MARERPVHDLIVIGAGINGAAIAREAALGGCSVLVLEQTDIACGTTSASTRLIHGGLRYLEHGELGLVRESLREREGLLASAPHLVEPLRLYLPIYRGARRPRWQVRVGLTLYDLLSLGKSVPSHEMLSRAELLRRLPGLNERDLVGGAAYFDAQVRFPERLVVENLLDAVSHGAHVMTHTCATTITVEHGEVRGVEWRGSDGSTGAARARAVVNAAGPWVDEVAEGIAGGNVRRRRLVGGTKGSHLVVESFAGAPEAAIYSEAASDGRPFFVVPWNGMFLIGTTDVRYDGDPAVAAIDDDEFAYLVAETERLFPASGGMAGRVLYTQAGIRALPYAPGTAEGAITRRHLIRSHRGARGMYSIVGGKLTTHRALAREVIERLRRDGALGRSEEGGGRGPMPAATAAHAGPRRLPGALDEADRAGLVAELTPRFGARRAVRLCATYGRIAERLMAAVTERPELAESAAEDSGLLRVELVHAIEVEYAQTLIDILQRRTMLGLRADFGLTAATAAARALVELGVWDSARAAHEVDGYVRYAAAHRARGASGYRDGGSGVDAGQGDPREWVPGRGIRR